MDSLPVERHLADAGATERLGAAVAELVAAPEVIALHGDLGAGKTSLARGFIRHWAGDAELAIPSPTFTLVEVYDTPRGAIWHFDLYRLKSAEEALELGIEDAFAEAVALIEWPERLGGLLPARRLDIELAAGAGARRAVLAGDPSWQGRLERLGRP